MPKRITVVLVLVLAGALGSPASSQAAPLYPTPSVVVGTDAISDWGGGGNNAIIGHALGQDLSSARIRMPAGDTVEFTMQVTWLPDAPQAGIGGVPEVSRYTWDMLVDGRFVELDGKFTNYSRGACDPTSGQCPPPRDPGPAPFLVRGNCVTNDSNVTTCQELARLAGTFNAAARTITVAVPSELLGLVECSEIKGGRNLFGGSISASPSAFFSTSAAPLDTMDVLDTFQVPTSDAAGCS